MQRSNAYIFTYILILTLVSGVLLSFVSEMLKDRQKANIAFEKKKFILTTVMGQEKIDAMQDNQISETYDKLVKTYVVNFEGKKLDNVATETIDVAKEYKLEPSQRRLPVYEILSETDPNKSEYFVLPIFGFGLWDNIWGYLALQGDLNTIKGVVFDHKGETPGLGARITTPEIQSRYTGKKIFDESGKLISIKMMKGENGGGDKSIQAFQDNEHQVDGMSGATLTGNGINNMFDSYLNCYQSFFLSKRTNSQK